MNIYNLNQGIKIPYNIVKGSVVQRQTKANVMTDRLFNNICRDIKSDSSVFKYSQLQKYINDVIPEKDFKVIVKKISEDNAASSDGLCEVIYNAKKDIVGISISVSGEENHVKLDDIPTLIHEFQHVADDFFHPKFLSRLKNLNKKHLDNNKYLDLYDNYYYCSEFVEGKKDKKNIIKTIKYKTLKFLKGLNIEDRMNYIQDMRYSLMSEIAAYRQQIKIAMELKNKGILIREDDLVDYTKEGLFEDKIKLLNNLAMEYISKARAKNVVKHMKNSPKHKIHNNF